MRTKKRVSSRPLSAFFLCWCVFVGHATDFYGGDHPNNDASCSDDDDDDDDSDDDDDFWWGECATGKTRAKNKCAKRQKQFKEMASSSSRFDTTFPKTTTLRDVLDDDDDDDGQRNGGGKGRRRGNHVEDER